jgi:hypothetical protein
MKKVCPTLGEGPKENGSANLTLILFNNNSCILLQKILTFAFYIIQKFYAGVEKMFKTNRYADFMRRVFAHDFFY